MIPPTVVLQRLKDAGITEAAIIDDVFDGPANADIKTNAGEFVEYVEDDPEASDELQKQYGVAPGKPIDIDVARKLWKDRGTQGPALRKYVDALLSEYQQRLDAVMQIEGHLRSLKLDVRCYGDAAKDPDKLPPKSTRFILLDYALTPDENRPRNEASEWCAKELCQRSNRPFLVLISDQIADQAHQEEFRRVTELVGGMFAFVPKQQARRSDVLYLKIGVWMLASAARSHLQEFVTTVSKSMPGIANDFMASLRKFSVQDYAFIQRVTLEEDGQPLGEYMLEFLSGLLSHQFRADPEIQRTREKLDRIVFEQHIASEAQPTPELARMYVAALTEPVFGDIRPHPQEVGLGKLSESDIASRAYAIWEAEGCPSDRDKENWSRAIGELSAPLPVLALGDIFIRDARSGVWMVVNAVCDLIFSPRSRGRPPRREQPIYLIPGTLNNLSETRETEGKEVTELFAFDGRTFRIVWDYRYVRSIPLEEFGARMSAKGYRRIARLALPYALKIQRSWTAHLDRIGVPSPPPMFEQADISVYARDARNEWRKIVGPVSGGAVLIRRKISDGYEELFVLTMNGEAAVYGSLLNVIDPLNEQVAELEERLKTADLREREFLPAKINKIKLAREKLVGLQEDVEWRLQLIEHPIGISLHGAKWIIPQLLAVHFEAGAQRSFLPQAQVAVDISRPSLASKTSLAPQEAG